MDKKQPSSSVPQAVHDCRNLIKWMIPHIDKLPRNRRFTLGERLENRLLLILESLVTAAYVPNKRSFLFQANRDLAVCRHLWRLCYDFRAIPLNSYQFGGKLMLELGKQVGGWMKAA
ncbi:diversity-generating retroelement protein Avd [Candidatus Thiothrix sp. Deng01]|uniref:Diversity-generating retroelement protein Avd n=1 Tax=Candidatus Thiothrix phosphatis TaxID=3112415 RepID=A0ABU6CXB9_9GAMM|nr:diversity-generating retroelement protein Avd [Candidatus Thiothrix sp. Deng01]MEB4591474.1 diversity-generating retroelement protein Avd [Candidatus Thiothrix sp. Deng01]